MFDGEGKAKVAVEKEVALSFKRVNDKYIIQTSRTVRNVWDYIDFNFIVGQGRQTMPESIECRSGTKLNSSWGIDIIQYIYTELKMYDEKEADSFISCLRKIVDELDDDKKNTFNFGLKLIGIEKMVGMSGGMRRILPQKSPSTDIENLLQELTNIENHLKEMYVLTYHDDKNDKIKVLNDKIKVLNYNLNYNYNQWLATDIVAEPSPIVPVVVSEPYNYYLFYSVIKYYNHIIEHFSRDTNYVNDSYKGIRAKLESINKLITNFDINYWEEPIDNSYRIEIIKTTVKQADSWAIETMVAWAADKASASMAAKEKSRQRDNVLRRLNTSRKRAFIKQQKENLLRGRQRQRQLKITKRRVLEQQQKEPMMEIELESSNEIQKWHPYRRGGSNLLRKYNKNKTQKRHKTQKKHKTQKRRSKK
jgi:hypothetical protein